MQLLVNKLKRVIYEERSAHKLALSFCMGSYIAFSPFIFLHTVMAFGFSWLFNLNLPLVFTGSCLINNPWSMIPVYLSGYIFGYWLTHSVFNLPYFILHTWWMEPINNFFEQTLSLSAPCLLAFLIGGNILGILCAVVLYPVMKRVFAQLIPDQTPLRAEKNENTGTK